jgi:hypothetical protein
MTEKLYIGTRIVKAEEMDKATFNGIFHPHFMGFDSPDNYTPGYKVTHCTGDAFWVPVNRFLTDYRELDDLEVLMVLDHAMADPAKFRLGRPVINMEMAARMKCPWPAKPENQPSEAVKAT